MMTIEGVELPIGLLSECSLQKGARIEVSTMSVTYGPLQDHSAQDVHL